MGLFSKLFGSGKEKSEVNPSKINHFHNFSDKKSRDQKLNLLNKKSLENKNSKVTKKSEVNISKNELNEIMKKELEINKKISRKFDKHNKVGRKDHINNNVDEEVERQELKIDKKISRKFDRWYRDHKGKQINKVPKGNEVKLTNKKGKLKKDGEIYLKTFVPGFDDLVDPGIPEGSSVLVEGGPGSGKTLFCLTLLREQCLKGKKVLYMSFEEPEERLRRHINQFGLNAKEYEKKGLLYIKRFNALDIARSVEALLSEAKKELLIDVQPVLIPPEFKPDIVLIDSLTSIASAFSGESSRFRIYMEQLFRYLESNNITSFLIREVGNPTHIGGTYVEQGEAVSFLSDGIVAIYSVFYQSGIRKRALEFVKMRGVDIKRQIVEFEITGKGVIIRPNKLIGGDYKLT